MKKAPLSLTLTGLLLCGTLAYADFADGLVGGLVGGAVGSVITNEVYNSKKSSQPKYRPVHRKSHKKYHTTKRISAPVMNDAMKIQKALKGLGFYHGALDGEVNSFETRTAIKEMNNAYGIGNTAALRPEERDTLVYLGTLFAFDRNLIARGNDRITRGKRIQTALKVLGFYHGTIDGSVGPMTRNAIAAYQQAYGMGASPQLDFEAEYQLISNARAANDKNINDSIASLKAMGRPATPQNIGQPAPKPQDDTMGSQPKVIQMQPINAAQPNQPAQSQYR